MDREQREQWRQADRLFQKLIDLDGPGRSRVLASIEVSPAVREKLQSLLQVSEEPNRLLDGDSLQLPWLEIASAGSVQASEHVQDERRIGDWALQELIGRGGMSAVYRARRVGHDYDQQAAVKLLGMALPGPVEQARFRREQRILAQLQHPHIASLIEAGVDADGTAYLAMSLVDGERIDSYGEQHALGAAECVHLVLQVCSAVSHAHRQLVIHRDIKPGNILVDENGHATLLDFGIARLLDADSTNETTITQAFTPDYAAPEQRERHQVLGTPVDIYGLGAVLHRLLTGAAPTRDVHGDMVLPSRVVRERGRAQQAAALRGDLDAILGHALAVDPSRRYATVDALADDLGAWLQHRPVRARRTTAWTHVHKFVRRNRAACSLALITVLAITAGLAVWLASQSALRQRATELQAVTDFHSRILRGVRPDQVAIPLRSSVADGLQKYAPGDHAGIAAAKRLDYTGIAARMLDGALLKPALQAARTEFAGQPRVQASLLQTLANSYRDLGLLDTAGPVQRQATELFRRTFGDGDPRTLASMRDALALLLKRSYGNSRIQGERQFRKVLSLHRRYLATGDVGTALASPNCWRNG